MHERVAVQTFPTHHLRIGGLVLEGLCSIHGCHGASRQVRTAVDAARVVAAVAVLAQPGQPGIEQRGAAGTMGRMAIGTVLRHRLVLPQEGTALLIMAGEAGLIDRILGEQLWPGGAVRIVAIRAPHFSGQYRVR